MSRKNRILFALVSSVFILAAALFFINQNLSAKTAPEKLWLTVDVIELRQMQSVGEGEGRPLNVEVVRVENGIAVVRATEDEMSQISEHGHEEFHKCGGFIAHANEADALETIANFARTDNNAVAVDYTINNAATAQALMNGMAASNIVATINGLTAFTTRHHSTPTGAQSAQWIKDQWTALAAGRSDVTVQFVQHAAAVSPQPSVVLTIQGTAQPNEYVVLGAHQDSIRSGCSTPATCIAPGADDDASGVASLTEVIRMAMTTNYRPAKTVQFMAYAAEEVGLRGSAAIASSYQTNGTNVIGAFQLDMTNYKSATATNDIGLVTDFTNAAQNQFIRDLRAAYLPTVTMTNTTCGYACSDHASWNNRGFPASFPHEATLATSNPRIHTANDTLANSDATGAHALKFSKLAAAYIAELAKGNIIIPDDFGSERADFDGDGKTDLSVYRPENGTWYVQQSSNNNSTAFNFGLSEDVLAPGDFDGDGKTDYAVFRPSNGTWYLLKSAGGFSALQFGLAGDIPAVGDFDGDLKSDIAVYRGGVWYQINSSDNAVKITSFGLSGDKPVVGDYDGDGKDDIAVFRPSDGVWYQLRSQGGFSATAFGIATDQPTQADFDGDGKTDLAVYREGVWHILGSQAGYSVMQFGIASDKPSVGDYDGDGKADVAVYRGGTWYLSRSTSGIGVFSLGLETDKPVPASYIPQ